MLSSKNIPLYYHPGTIVLVDDQSSYLRSMITAIDYVADCRGFSEPEAALKFIKEQKFAHLEFSDDQNAIIIKPEVLAAYLMNDRRFELVSTVVVDYNMPGMTGLEFCRRIKDPYIRKIMLTGEANSDLAVQAFNEGIINKFFKKSAEHAVEDLNDSILKAQFNYFAEQTDLFFSAATKKYLPSFLQNRALIELLLDLIKSEKCTEFYFLNYEGDALLLNQSGEMQLLMVRGEKEMQAVAQEIEQIYLDEPMESLGRMVAGFKSFELIAEPVPHAEKNANLASWQKRSHAASRLEVANDVIYYAQIEIKNNNLFGYINRDIEIFALNKFEGLFEVK